MKFLKLISLHLFIISFAFAQSDFKSLNESKFDLGGKRAIQKVYYKMDTNVLTFGIDGELQDELTMSLYLIAEIQKNGSETYTCEKFELKFSDGKIILIPKLNKWNYTYKMGIDEKNQVFGIEHSHFENLLDNEGNPLPAAKSYFIYNSFIDFHGFNNVFSEPVGDGEGIEELQKIGDKIIHEAANTKAPTNLGSNFTEGSYFQNGEITLELMGISAVKNNLCGIIKYDSGESSFKMLMTPAPNIDVTTFGRSHYFGEIYKNLQSGWIEKANMTEIVITETTLPMPPNKINSVVERHIILKQVDQKEFTDLTLHKD